MHETVSKPPASPRPVPDLRSGWWIGIFCGVIACLLALPPVRYTLFAQLQFALSEESVPFTRALDARRSARETARLDTVAAAASDDYLLQVGRATALALDGGLRPNSPKAASVANAERAYSDHTLYRLGDVARAFPIQPGAYAHLARYMMVGRLRIQRSELNARPGPVGMPAHPDPSDHPTALPFRRDVRLMEWALRSGAKRDPDNAFWPTMLSITYFAAERDNEALAALARAARAKRWDAFLYEEVLGQWRLFSAAYGDNGAAQKIGPLSLVAFPHLRELRSMAQMARWHAQRAEKAGRYSEAIRIRRNLAWLGILLRDSAQWAYEALIGTDLFFISSADDATLPTATIQTVDQWNRRSQSYLALLLAAHHDTQWLLREAETCCALRQRVNLARFDTSFPGIPPGIPLVPLFASWMAGVCLLQQMLAFIAGALFAFTWSRHTSRRTGFRVRFIAAGFILAGTFAAGALAFLGGIPRPAIVFLIGSTWCLITGLEQIHRWTRDRAGRTPRGRDRFEDAHEGDDTAETLLETRWQPGTTLRMSALVLTAGLGALYLLHPYLSGMHPVAILLAGMVGISRGGGPEEALFAASLAAALPLVLVVASGCWGLYRGVSPCIAVRTALLRVSFPAFAGLAIVYLLLLGRTLRLDGAASHAISQAAQNDLEWVLTHADTAPPR